MEEKKIPQEIEVISTIEIHHIYGEEDLRALAENIPMTMEELALFKHDFADAVAREVETSLEADAVNVASVQYFEYEAPETAACETVTA